MSLHVVATKGEGGRWVGIGTRTLTVVFTHYRGFGVRADPDGSWWLQIGAFAVCHVGKRYVLPS